MNVAATERETEPMNDASSEHGPRQTGSGRGGRKTGGAQAPVGDSGARGAQAIARQSPDPAAVVRDQNPHGVKLAPKAAKGALSEPGNLAAVSPALGQ
jgi:hypothetical protein